MNSTAVSDPQVEVERRQRQAIKVLNDGRVRISNHLIVTLESDSWRALPRFAVQDAQQRWEGVVGFTTNDDIHTWKRAQCRNVDDGCLRAAQNNLRIRIFPPDLL